VENFENSWLNISQIFLCNNILEKEERKKENKIHFFCKKSIKSNNFNLDGEGVEEEEGGRGKG
jgi:hypothetical protein